jgi:hypothetical protein
VTYAVVAWNDAHCNLAGVSKNEAEVIRPVLTHSVGHVVSQNKSGVVLAVDFFPNEYEAYANWHFIPTGRIVSVTSLELGKK